MGRSNRLKAIVGVAAAMLVTGEVALRVFDVPTFENGVELLMRRQMDRVNLIDPDSMILVGDSSLGNGINARILGALLRQPVLNLSLVGSFGTYGDERLVQFALARGKKPQSVVIFHTPDMWMRPDDPAAMELLRREFGDVTLEGFSKNAFSFMHLVTRQRSLRMLVFDDRGRMDLTMDRVLHAKAQEHLTTQAFVEVDFVPQGPKLAWEAVPAMGLPRFVVDRDKVAAFRRTLAGLATANVTTYVAIGPFRQKILDLSGEYESRLVAFLQAEISSFPQAKLIYAEIPGQLDDNLQDTPDHLTLDGKDIFTSWFARKIADVRAKATP